MIDIVYVMHVVYLSVSLSLTLSRNEKIELHIRNKTHKPNVLRFWVEGGVILLCGLGLVLILILYFQCLHHLFSQQVVLKSMVYDSDRLRREYNLILVSKVFLIEVLSKRVSFQCKNDCTSEDSFHCVSDGTSEDRVWVK